MYYVLFFYLYIFQQIDKGPEVSEVNSRFIELWQGIEHAGGPGGWIRNGEVSRESYLGVIIPLLYPGDQWEQWSLEMVEHRSGGDLRAEHMNNETVDKR